MIRLAALLSLVLLAAPVLAQEPPEGAYADFLPNADGEPFNTWGETAPDTGLVTRIFALSFAEPCSWGILRDPERRKPDIYETSFRYPFDEADAADRPMTIYRFFCNAGAYNEQHVYMVWDGDNGLRPASFAQPSYSADFVDPDNSDSALKRMSLTGFTARTILTNSDFDADSRTITSHACFRGICDAASSGTWVLDGSDFRLQSFAVDPSYDGEENPIELVNYSLPIEILLRK
jgi:hypothetical protein